VPSSSAGWRRTSSPAAREVVSRLYFARASRPPLSVRRRDGPGRRAQGRGVERLHGGGPGVEVLRQRVARIVRRTRTSSPPCAQRSWGLGVILESPAAAKVIDRRTLERGRKRSTKLRGKRHGFRGWRGVEVPLNYPDLPSCTEPSTGTTTISGWRCTTKRDTCPRGHLHLPKCERLFRRSTALRLPRSNEGLQGG